MRNKVILIILVIAIGSLISACQSNEAKLNRLVQGNVNNKETIEKLRDYYYEKDYHKEAFVELAFIASEAKYNVDTIDLIADLIATKGYHTDSLLDIAKIAAKTETECDEFTEIARLAVDRKDRTAVIVDLAKSASKGNTEEVKNKIAKLKGN